MNLLWYDTYSVDTGMNLLWHDAYTVDTNANLLLHEANFGHPDVIWHACSRLPTIYRWCDEISLATRGIPNCKGR